MHSERLIGGQATEVNVAWIVAPIASSGRASAVNAAIGVSLVRGEGTTLPDFVRKRIVVRVGENRVVGGQNRVFALKKVPKAATQGTAGDGITDLLRRASHRTAKPLLRAKAQSQPS
jgi:hypothetical protein